MSVLLLSAFCAVLVAASVSDLLSMSISNRLIIILMAIFPAWAVATGMPGMAIAMHVVVGCAVLAVTFGCFAAGWMGGGDAKLIAAVALWLGPTAALASFVVWTSILGGGLTLVFLLARACFAPTTGLVPLDRLLRRDVGIPYGVAIGAGGLLCVPALSAGLTV